MKIELDLTEKTISIKDDIKIDELITVLKKFGKKDWKDWTIKQSVEYIYNSYPYPYPMYYSSNPDPNPYRYEITTGDACDTGSGSYNNNCTTTLTAVS